MRQSNATNSNASGPAESSADLQVLLLFCQRAFRRFFRQQTSIDQRLFHRRGDRQENLNTVVHGFIDCVANTYVHIDCELRVRASYSNVQPNFARNHSNYQDVLERDTLSTWPCPCQPKHSSDTSWLATQERPYPAWP